MTHYDNDQHILQFFEFKHLPPALPGNDERTMALRKLLEAKDCAVRAMLCR